MPFNNSINANQQGTQYLSTAGVWFGIDGGTAGTILTSNGTGIAPSFQSASASGAITSISGNSGGPEVPLAGNFNILGSGSISVDGSANTETVQLTGLTNHSVLVGAGTSTITKVGPTATVGQVLQSAGVAADPAFSTATYPLTTTINQLLYSSATNVVSGLATANQSVLTTGATGTPVLTALGMDGQLIIGSTAGIPLAATLTAGTGISITNGANSISIAVNGSTVGETITGNSGGALSPTAGNWNILGTSTAAGTLPVTTSGAASTLTVNVQKSQALAATDATKVGLANFNSTQFSVDANGFVSTSGTGILNTLTGNSGGAISPTAGNINTIGTGSITIAGSGSSLTTQLTGLTNHNVLLGAGTATITNVAPSATSGVPLISQGAAADPAFGTAVVAGGGTGDTSFTAFAPVCGGTTTTGALQSATTGFGTSGFVLTSTGSGSLPTWQATGATGITTINGDTGSITGTTVTIKTGVSTINSGSSISFVNSGTTSTLNTTDSLFNVLLGSSAGNATLSGSANVGIGRGVLQQLTTGNLNTMVGDLSGDNITTGSGNTACGEFALSSISTGTANAALGAVAGQGLSGSDSHNIMIANGGTPGDNNTIRIGDQANQTKCFIAGITGVSVSNLNYVTLNTSTGQLGAAATASSMTWTNVTGTTQTIAVAAGYLSNNAGTITFTLPASATLGDIFRIVGVQGAWTVAQAANQQIKLGNAATTVGVTGSLTSTNAGDCIECVATNTSASTVWRVMSSMGNITVA